MMKIAVPSNDQKSVNQHFGRSKGFLIITVQESEITDIEYRENTFTGHATNNHNHSPNHSHSGIMNALSDCTVIIAGGMGQRLYEEFQSTGKEVFVTKHKVASQAIAAYINNSLDNNKNQCCQH
ncbi:MAG: iron-molybdenum cofactor biosynthesis protein [Bacteroidetes bacterium]|jgi:predicted Fe-Mo cluster-binding NifX family protein|nr:iron-molybdenum cofactor biosynthesis protein [Bacteroidota bacterium]MBT7491787.1 iron-molybdenum cofactor biosynthesis protein [Bacteroidota bacterium]